MNLAFDNYLFLIMFACAIIMMAVYFYICKKNYIKLRAQIFELLLILAASFIVGVYLLYVALFSTEISYKLPLGEGMLGYEFRLGIFLGGAFLTKHSLSTIISQFLRLSNRNHTDT